MTKGRRIPLWLNIILISFAVILVVGALFCLASGISAGTNHVSFAEGCSNIWFSIFPGLKQTTEEVIEVVEPVVEALV